MSERREVGRWEGLAYARAGADFDRGADRGLVFDYEAADRAVGFFSKYLRFGKGEWGGRPFLLSEWEEFIVRSLFGWRREDGTRRFRTAYVEVPRKNGKTELAAGLGLYLLTYDMENGPEVYSAATQKEQARIVFNAAKAMVRQSRDLKRHLTPRQTAITCEENGGTFQPLSSDYNNLDGLNVHGAILDELHAWKKRELFDVIESAQGARRQPLVFIITTAGVSRQTVCWELRQYSEKVLDGIFEDDSFFAFIAAADKEDDWREERTWRKANPNFGVSVKPEFLAEKCIAAQRSASAVNPFMRYYLNQWVTQEVRWLDQDQWRGCADADYPLEALAGRPCWLGVDLSKTTDLTAVGAVFPPWGEDERWRFLAWGFVPAERVEDRVRRDSVPYDAWIREGHLTATPGNVVDYEFVDKRVLECVEMFDVKEVCFDPWNAVKWATDLQKAGLGNLVEVRQGGKTLSPACKEFERLVLSGLVGHWDNPVLNWCVSNVCVTADSNENIRPDKSKSTERIDLVAALVTAMARAVAFVEGVRVVKYDGLVVG